MTTVGLTGGIGSGKSTVSRMLAQLGAIVIDADSVGHEIYLPGTEGWTRITQAFGEVVLTPDRTIDRKKLGAIVFSDTAALGTLNAIVHPLMFAEIQRRIQATRTQGISHPIVVEAAILIEANWLPLVDQVWVVVAEKSAVVERVASQRGLSAQDTEARISSQLSNEDRERHASVVIRNNGSLEALGRQVQAAWDRISR